MGVLLCVLIRALKEPFKGSGRQGRPLSPKGAAARFLIYKNELICVKIIYLIKFWLNIITRIHIIIT